MVKVDFDKESRRSPESHELLSRDREQELLERIAQGDIDARNKLIEHNLGFVISEARRFAWSIKRADLEDDLISVGVIYLIGAAKGYVTEKSKERNNGEPVKFLTYAYRGFRTYMQRALTEMRYIVRPKGSAKYGLYRKTVKEVRKEGLDLTAEIVSMRSGISLLQVQRYLEFDRKLQISIDSSSNEDGATLRDGIQARDKGDLERIADTDTIRTHLPRLSPKQRAVIELRYLTNDLTFREIGERFGVYRTNIQQIEARALKKLKMLIETKNVDAKVPKDVVFAKT